MMKIGIIGAGRIGTVHALSLGSVPNAKLTAVSDPHQPSAQSLAEKTGAEIRSSEAIIEADDIDAIIIATPTTTHFDLIQSGAKAKKAIFCEKPIDMDADRIRECIKVVEENDVAFMTGFNRRFDINFANVKSRIANGEIGEVELVTILSRDPSPPPIEYVKTSGGIFRDMMIHDFDMARFLLGEEPISVHAVGSCLIDKEIGEVGDVDTAAATLTTASGKICTISNSRRASYGYDQRLEVHGSKGMLRAGNVLQNTVEVANGSGFSSAATEPFFLQRYSAAYVAELQYFISCLENGERPKPSATDGLLAQLIADAATHSMKTMTTVRL